MSVRSLVLGLAPALCVVVGALASLAGPALALNPERHYELVSPPFKDGYGASLVEAVAQNGESVAFFSPGAFAGAPAGLTARAVDRMPYIARRGAAGWVTTSLLPPPILTPLIYKSNQEVSPTLDETAVLGTLGPTSELAFLEGSQFEFFSHSVSAPDTATDWEAGPSVETPQKAPLELNIRGASANLCHFILEPGTRSNAEQLLPGSVGSEAHLYEASTGCDGEPASLRFLGLDNAGKLISPACSEELGLAGTGYGSAVTGNFPTSSFNAVSAGGREVFFTASTAGDCKEGVFQLFVRVGGVKTIEVSRPSQSTCAEVPCGGEAVAAARSSAEFIGASRDGSRVFFTTRAPLVEADKDEGSDLYMATIGCSSGVGEACAPGEAQNTSVTSLEQLSQDSHAGEAAEVQGVVGVAPDGSRAYFVARGLLGEGFNAQGLAPVRGADNLYVYDNTTARAEFIAELCSGPGLSGVVEDVHCPADLGEEIEAAAHNDTPTWTGPREERKRAQTAGLGGQFLVFASYGQLVPGDTDTALDVYRYDAATGALERVSVGEGGYDSNGNNDLFDATISLASAQWGAGVQEQYEMNSRAMSEDGSRIVFTTVDPLSPDATNGLENAYEWHQASGETEGKVSLISSGSSSQAVSDVVISPEGKDVFFATSQGLVAQDTDNASDIYDARLGAGFPAVAAPPQECSGDACQGPLTNPAPLLVPGSLSQAPGDSFSPAAVVPGASDFMGKGAKCKHGYVKRENRCIKSSIKGRKARAKKRSFISGSLDRRDSR
jgi:hypothetical protein